jgi:hypothetical protein
MLDNNLKIATLNTCLTAHRKHQTKIEQFGVIHYGLIRNFYVFMLTTIFDVISSYSKFFKQITKIFYIRHESFFEHNISIGTHRGVQKN